MKRLFVIMFVFALSACSEPTIDASTDETLEVSIKKVRASLPANQQEEFDNAIATLAFKNLNFGDILSGNTDNVESQMKAGVDGLTGTQVILAAEQTIAQRREKEKIQALEEIAELEAKVEAANLAAEKLKSFEVLRSRFYIQESEYSFGRNPIIELAVRNSTDKAVSRVFFVGTVASPNREIPWIVETFNYTIPGGLEPRESAEWSLSPNMFSDWGTVKVPSDAILTVTVVKLLDANENAFLDAEGISDQEEKRLNSLRAKFSKEL